MKIKISIVSGHVHIYYIKVTILEEHVFESLCPVTARESPPLLLLLKNKLKKEHF
jgi:hypothetical protein